jgi:hypothetical protein
VVTEPLALSTANKVGPTLPKASSQSEMETALAKSLYELRKGDFMLSQCIPKSLYENKFLNRAKVEI